MHETQKNFVKRTKAADHRWRRRRAPLSRRLCTTSLHWTDRRSWEVCRYLSRTKQDLSDRSHHSSYLISLGSSSEVELNWIELSWAGLGWIRTPAAQFRWDEMRWDQLEPRKHGFNVRPDYTPFSSYASGQTNRRTYRNISHHSRRRSNDVK